MSWKMEKFHKVEKQYNFVIIIYLKVTPITLHLIYVHIDSIFFRY